MTPQPRQWHGMGHRIGYSDEPSGEDEGKEKERSDTPSSGSAVAYTVKEDGEVEPIAGEGEEEEEEEEGEGEEEGGGGPNFPALPKNLSTVFTIHKELLFDNDPDLSEDEWELNYIAPSGATYLAVCFVKNDREAHKTAGSGKSAAGNLTMTLNGKEPDTFQLSGPEANYAGETSGSGTTWHGKGVAIWHEPEDGPLVIKLVGPEGISGGIGQTYMIFLPISVKGEINEPKSAITNGGKNNTNPDSYNSEFKLPGAYIHISALAKDTTPPVPTFTVAWTGYKVFGGTTTSPIGRGRLGAFELFIGLKETGTYAFETVYQTITDLYGSYGGRALAKMDL